MKGVGELVARLHEAQGDVADAERFLYAWRVRGVLGDVTAFLSTLQEEEAERETALQVREDALARRETRTLREAIHDSAIQFWETHGVGVWLSLTFSSGVLWVIFCLRFLLRGVTP